MVLGPHSRRPGEIEVEQRGGEEREILPGGPARPAVQERLGLVLEVAPGHGHRVLDRPDEITAPVALQAGLVGCGCWRLPGCRKGPSGERDDHQARS